MPKNDEGTGSKQFRFRDQGTLQKIFAGNSLKSLLATIGTYESISR